MKSLDRFSGSARELSGNPLGIIALFIVLVYGFASLVVGFGWHLSVTERMPIVIFLVCFPVLVLGVFAWLVSQHHMKLYGPKDFRDETIFLEGITERSRRVSFQKEELEQLEKTLAEKLYDKIKPNDSVGIGVCDNAKTAEVDKIGEITSSIISEVIGNSYITIDASEFNSDNGDVFVLPAMSFASFGDLLDYLHSLMRGVGPFEYGHSWALENLSNGSIVKNMRMLAELGPGMPVPDTRSLREVGIIGGSVLKVVKPWYKIGKKE